ncbi:MAG: YunC family protein [Candidatus Hydrothermarchaeota archaeon]
MIQIEELEIEKSKVLGIKVDLPLAPLILLKGKRGFLMCGYLNIQTAEKLGDSCAMVTGVRTFEDVMNADIKAVTTRAKNLGIREGMKGREAIKIFGAP